MANASWDEMTHACDRHGRCTGFTFNNASGFGGCLQSCTGREFGRSSPVFKAGETFEFMFDRQVPMQHWLALAANWEPRHPQESANCYDAVTVFGRGLLQSEIAQLAYNHHVASSQTPHGSADFYWACQGHFTNLFYQPLLGTLHV
jgi:hypothetical protein